MSATCNFFFMGGWWTLVVILLGLAAAMILVRIFYPPRKFGFRRVAAADRDDALRILRLRLADGAITPEAFERLRRAVDPLESDGNK
jgi:putative membrane protein